MKQALTMRILKVLVPGVILLQAAGCNFATVNEAIQTVLLGVTAAGSVAILRNI